MNITFFIGNGFDLNLGLKTGYRDFFPFFINTNPDNILAKEIKGDIDLWSNLEVQLGLYAGGIKQEEKVAFLTAKEELEDSLIRYLNTIVTRKMLIDAAGAEEFRKKVVGFIDMLTVSEQDHFKRIVTGTRESIHYWFITFNYTDFLDRIYETVREIKTFGQHNGGGTIYTDVLYPPLHIHGTLESEMLLGVNDESQVGIKGSNHDPDIVRYMVKPVVNDSLGNHKTSQAHGIIDNSRYICVYGMSLGYTDKDWWVYIANWLLKSGDNRLILFMHEGNGRPISGSRQSRLQDDERRRFLSIADKESDYDKLSSQIIVRFNSPIFNFKSIKVGAEKNG